MTLECFWYFNVPKNSVNFYRTNIQFAAAVIVCGSLSALCYRRMAKDLLVKGITLKKGLGREKKGIPQKGVQKVLESLLGWSPFPCMNSVLVRQGGGDRKREVV